ncbi:MAG: protease Lon-related BREX system protein BrxL [Deltaproteobacteria bacterium]|nr:protease Lon-related BREX system protein BrxL [Deltaproteobacteria bacterium]
MSGSEANQALPLDEAPVDDLDRKLLGAFSGRVVRKDLVKRLKVGYNIPVYVLEYLLGKFCSTTNRDEVEAGLQQVKETITERIVRADQGELIKARLQKQGSMKIIDLCTVTFDEKDQGGKYWARLATSGLDFVHVEPDLVHRHERLFTGGIWANIELSYDETIVHRGATRPFVLQRLAPIQIASARYEEFVEGRRRFTRDEWTDVLLRTMGYEPTQADFTPRRKWLYLLRLLPLVERNFNLVELGPRGTGKSYVFRELSPYAILLSGGQVTIPKLFASNAPPYGPGLVTRWDVVAFDEVAGSHFKRPEDKQLYKDYMELGSFSRGSAKGTVQGEAGFVFNGNLDGEVETIARTSHLFLPFPDTIRNDMAFHDRWHAYLPGWELPKMQPGYFTAHLGFIADYIAEVFHNELRPRSYADVFERHFRLGSHVEERDRKAIAKTTSGMLKLLHPDGECTKAEVEECLCFAMELRRRVKEQLRRMGGVEYARVNLSYIDRETRQETFVTCKELGATQLIPSDPLPPGDVFTVGHDPAEGRYSLFRIQCTVAPGGGRFSVLGVASKGLRESARMAYDYLRASSRKVGLDRDFSGYDVNLQVMSLTSGRDALDLGMAFYVALLSATLGRSLGAQLVVLGQMSLHGVLTRVEGLGDKLRVAMDAGARCVLIPTENSRDFAQLPPEVLDRLRIEFYSEPSQGAFKALAE